MDIKTLLSLPESKTLEFKENISSITPVLKTIVAFANTAGGILIIGRASNGNIVGVNDVFKAEETLTNSISDCIRPTILPEIEIATVESKNIIIVQVAHWKAPFYLKKEGLPDGVYVRLGSTNRPATPEMIAELKRNALNLSFDQEPLHDLDKKELDHNKIAQFFAQVDKKITDEKLCTLGVLDHSHRRLVPTIGGLILFGSTTCRNQIVPEAKVTCARFGGINKIHLLDSITIEGTILDALDEVPKFISRNTRISSQIKDIRRKDIPEYPSLGIREALVNALAHADYATRGSCIQIAIFDNRLEIQNPGMLPFGLTLEDLKSGISRIRNRVIVRVFHELKFMEEWGSGYSRIIETCSKEGYPEPLWEELGTTMRVTFFPYREKLVAQAARSTSEKMLIDRQQIILNLLKENSPLSFKDIFAHFSSISERTIRYDLSYLKEIGLLTSTGTGRATTWKIVL